jgi:molybdopterin biosynthesis enzyme MoaB
MLGTDLEDIEAKSSHAILANGGTGVDLTDLLYQVDC